MAIEITDGTIDSVVELSGLLSNHFNGDTRKCIVWLTLKNPLLGGATPRTFIKFGKANKLVVLVKSALEGNYA